MLRRLGFEDAMDYRRISEFERGTTEPHLSVLLEYARAAGVHLEDIVDDERVPRVPPLPKLSTGYIEIKVLGDLHTICRPTYEC